MKKFIYLMFAILLTGCNCLLSQVPPQLLYVDANCQARLPDYTKIVQATDNCGLVTLTQLPAANTLLTASNPVTQVTVTGADKFGNKATLKITVTLVDTVPPVLNWPAGQAAMTEKDLNNIYQQWQEGVKVHGIAKWLYDQRWTQGLAFADTNRITNQLQYFTHVIKLDSTEYVKYVEYANLK